METDKRTDDLELSEAFAIIASIPSLKPVVQQVAEHLKANTLDKKKLEQILANNNLERVEDIKPALLDLLCLYINLVLNDHAISDKEFGNVKHLKLLFKIKEGDFYKLRREEIKEIIYKQLKLIYRDDNKISPKEAVHKVNLQGLFDLSYDQFLEFTEREIRISLEKGADIEELDTVRYPLKIKYNEEANGLNLNQEIKDLVWERDKGACTVCKSHYNIGFYPVVPFAKGGSATYRNVRLLCGNCVGQG